jgi:hypothetical protein
VITFWKVIIGQGKQVKRFREDLTGAIAFYRQMRKEGKEVHLVSANRGFPPFKPGHKRYEERPSSKHIWCPYCMKWRQFVYTALRDRDGQVSAAENRCPVCKIPLHDYNVKKYNGYLEHLDMEALKKQVGAW